MFYGNFAVLHLKYLFHVDIIISSSSLPDPLWGPPILLSNGYRGLSPRIKQLGCEDDHSSPSSAEVKNTWSYTSISIRLYGVVLS